MQSSQECHRGGSSSSNSGECSVVVRTSRTRYHVVRAAASVLGWCIDDEDRPDVPESFHGVTLTPHIHHHHHHHHHNGHEHSGAHEPSTHHRLAQVIWIDTSVSGSRVASLACYERLNHFAGMNVIARKAVLFRRLMRLAQRCERKDTHYATLGAAIRRFAPRSFSSCTDYAALEAYSEESESKAARYFIIKPNKGCMGKGIRITQHPAEQITAEERGTSHECLVQEYIDRPLLIEGHKFDLRLYVLLTSVTASRYGSQGVQDNKTNNNKGEGEDVLRGIELYVHRQGLVRLCAAPYSPPTEANCKAAEVHLTNYAVNKHSHDFFVGAMQPGTGAEHEEAQRVINERAVVHEGNKRDLGFVAAYIDALARSSHSPHTWHVVRRRIDECIVLTVLSGLETLRREMTGAGGTRGARADGRGCFELLGFDIMLHADTLQPLLMEVNHSPSLFCDSEFDFAVKLAVVTDTFRLLAPSIAPRQACVSEASYVAYMQQQQQETERSAKDEVAAQTTGFRRLLPCVMDEPTRRMCGDMVHLSRTL